jgi:hypothetical protein
MQNGFHRLIDSGVDVLPYSPVDETYLTAWVDADRYRLWKEAGDWRFGYWLNARALVTSDGQLDSAVSALGVASRRMLDIWAGLRHDWRSGYDEAVQRATAAEEQDLALVLGVRFGSLVLETVQQFDNASSYGQLRLMSLESAAGGRASAAPRLGLELGFLLPDVHLHLAGRVRSQLLVRDASVWNETVVASLDYGEPQYGDDPSAFIESTQIGIGFEWQRPVSDRSNWLSGYVSVAAGWRRERLIGDGLLSGQASAAVDRGVLIVGTGLRFHASTMGQRWRYRISRRQFRVSVAGRSSFQRSMNFTAAWTKSCVSWRPCSAVDSSRFRTPHTPVDDISRDDVPLPVSSAFRPSARNTRSAVGSPATTAGNMASRWGGRVSVAVLALAIENGRGRNRRSLPERGSSGPEVDGDARSLLVDAVDDEGGNRPVAAMGVENQETPEAVPDQALRGLDVNRLDRFRRQRNRAGEAHVIRRLPRQQDRRNQNVRLLGDQLGSLHAVQVVGTDRQVQAVLLKRSDRDDDHVRTRQKLADFR